MAIKMGRVKSATFDYYLICKSGQQAMLVAEDTQTMLTKVEGAIGALDQESRKRAGQLLDGTYEIGGPHNNLQCITLHGVNRSYAHVYLGIK